MFFPTSPRPPSGMMRQTPIRASVGAALRRGRAEDAGALEAAANPLELLLRRLDHRQAVAADFVTEKIERGLDRDRIRLHLQEVERRLHLVIQAPGPLDVPVLVPAHHLLRLRPPDMRVDA